MKKIGCLLLALVLVFQLTACHDNTEKEVITTPEETTITTTGEQPFVWTKFPIIDGSTSTILLETAFRMALLGQDKERATLDVHHTTTHESFQRLLNFECDLIFSVPISKEQQEAADDKNILLEMVPIAKEGFVFVVNGENPVDSLTIQQIQDIYSGKITNWSEVGGEDIPIIPYQRNKDSGSQNYMTEFMGDIPLMDAPTELMPGTMGGLMDAVALYDNSAGAIGYSVYSYAAKMYEEAGEVKFIAVNGVQPSNKTMEDGSYPLLSYTLAIYRASMAENSLVRRLVEWILSDEGQQAVKDAGYVTVSGESNAIETGGSSLYRPLGTGPKAPKDGEMPYLAVDYGGEWGPETILPQEISDTLEKNPDIKTYTNLGPIMGTQYQYTNLKNKALEKEINSFLSQSVQELEALVPEVSDLVDGRIERYGNVIRVPILPDGHCEYYSPVSLEYDESNGYLSLALFLEYRWGPDGRNSSIYACRTAIFDMVEGKRLSFSDLFYEGVSYIPYMNKEISKALYYDYMGYYSDTISEFWGLTEDPQYFTLDNIYLPHGNPYTHYGDTLFIDYPNAIMPLYFNRKVDYTTIFEVRDYKQNLSIENEEFSGEVTRDGFIQFYNMDSSYLLDSSTIDSIKNIIRKKFIEEESLGYYGEHREMSSVRVNIYGDLCIRIAFDESNAGELSAAYLYDYNTLEPFKMSTILKDGWEKAGTWYKGYDNNQDTVMQTIPNDYDTNYLTFREFVHEWGNMNDDYIILRYWGDYNMRSPYTVEIPVEYIKLTFDEYLAERYS